jgi:hypothetical protein
MIPARWYRWGTLGFSSPLGLGSLAIGFTLKQQIEGVDPFNISIDLQLNACRRHFALHEVTVGGELALT